MLAYGFSFFQYSYYIYHSSHVNCLQWLYLSPFAFSLNSFSSCLFYAPWCPACQQIEAAWENFAKESEHLDITVGKVDVTQEPGMLGIIVITMCLLLSAMDGVFRRYRGSRTSEDLQGYILERKWEAVEPVAGWKSPSSIMMHGIAGLFHFSGWIRVSNTNHYCSV
uniref:Thioredoxin domain-containing protein n=1 Tax=Chelonoidis abingdonii TaxID=106734 RepID=A0A8C0GD29_CHEAB